MYIIIICFAKVRINCDKSFIFNINKLSTTMVNYLIFLILFGILHIVSPTILICRADDENCDGNVTIYAPPSEYFCNTFSKEVHARIFSNPEYTGSVLDVPEGITDLLNYPVVCGSIVVREGWRVVITTLHEARFKEKLYVVEGDMTHVSFSEARVMRILVERMNKK